MTGETIPILGVVIVAFHSADIIAECLESVFASRDVEVRVVVVDNNSTDGTCQAVRDWASGRTPFQPPDEWPLRGGRSVPKPVALVDGVTGAPPLEAAPLTLLRSPVNGGYGYAVNHGLAVLMGDPSLSLFWVLNPDCVAAPETARVIVDSTRDGQFSLLGGRTIYYDLPDEIQTDGGRVSRWTGRCKSLHSGLSPRTTPMPAAPSLDYITGAHCVASRAFIEDAGLMREDYFLYYEEVDWAFRRRDLPLRVAPEAIVYHRGGTTIGTGSTVRRASPFANYFNYRNRIRFVRRFMPFGIVAAITYALVKAMQLMSKGGMDEAQAILCGSFGLDPPAAVRARIADPAAQALAVGRAGRGD